MRKLRALEDVLIRVESALAVVLVLVMLVLAAYNVVYRNVLVPLQQHWEHSGPPPEPKLPAPAVEATPAGGPETKAGPEPKAGGGDDFGGFGGGLDDDEPSEPKPETKAEPKAADDGFEGFGGGFDDDDEESEPAPAPKAEPEPTPEPTPEPKAADDGFGGFGGGFGDDDEEPEAKPETKAEPPKSADGADGFGGFGGGFDEDEPKVGPDEAPKADAKAEPEDDAGDDFGEDDLGGDDPFANLADIDVAAKKDANDVPKGGPPPEGSLAAWAVTFIDGIKLDWIDIFLRQLVIIVSFFGATLATQRGKHINVDALSKVLPKPVRRVVGVVLPIFAVVVCLVFANAGWDLVQISREYPKDLLPSVPEWTLQLMFPVGFGLLATHFAVRVVEALVDPPDLEPHAPRPVPAPAVAVAAEADAEDESSEDADADADASADKGEQG